MDKEYLVEELDQLLPKTEEPGYVVQETLTDPDTALILKLIQEDSDLKNALLELSRVAPKRRAFFIEVFLNMIKAGKKNKSM